jgi:hypothetical protein
MITGVSRRDSKWRGGGMAPFWINGRFPLRCDDDPFEFVRAIEGAERCEKVLGRCWGISIRS